VRNALQLANVALPAGKLVRDNREIVIETGNFLGSAADVRQLVIGTFEARPVFVSDVADVADGPDQPQRYVWTGAAGAEHPAVTLQITKKPGENAVEIARRIGERVAELKGTIIPHDVRVTVTRDYGATANDKAQQLIQKLLFATLSVVVLVLLALGRREALIVGVAVMLTLAATLFASWAWGFTLNRVSLFALIFSIGILVDDAIVVVENIHRRRLLDDRPLAEVIPVAVDEVGGPTILATFTVIAALLPMAFVSGLMGPYMSPIPINASLGMVISLAIAFTVTPWLALKLPGAQSHAGASAFDLRLERLFARLTSTRGVARVIRPSDLAALGFPDYNDNPYALGHEIVVSDVDVHFVLDPASTSTARRPKSKPYHGHGYLPSHPSMYPALVLSGAGVTPGKSIGHVKNVDVAPTIAALLSVSMPGVDGRVLREALR